MSWIASTRALPILFQRTNYFLFLWYDLSHVTISINSGSISSQFIDTDLEMFINIEWASFSYVSVCMFCLYFQKLVDSFTMFFVFFDWHYA